jgi:N-glycosylase/DNA lyase
MNTYDSESLLNAVACICPDIVKQVLGTPNAIDERGLWWELSSCILSSQVPYSLATAAADAIDIKSLLFCGPSKSESLTQSLLEVLKTPFMIEGRPRMYRFPTARAHHLAATHVKITSMYCSLRELLGACPRISKTIETLIGMNHKNM